MDPLLSRVKTSQANADEIDTSLSMNPSRHRGVFYFPHTESKFSTTPLPHIVKQIYHKRYITPFSVRLTIYSVYANMYICVIHIISNRLKQQTHHQNLIDSHYRSNTIKRSKRSSAMFGSGLFNPSLFICANKKPSITGGFSHMET